MAEHRALYRALLREARKFSNYNFKSYATRYVKEKARENQIVLTADADKKAAYDAGKAELEKLRRMSVVSQLYPQGMHATEKPR